MVGDALAAWASRHTVGNKRRRSVMQFTKLCAAGAEGCARKVFAVNEDSLVLDAECETLYWLSHV